jgi:hypothetical protein
MLHHTFGQTIATQTGLLHDAAQDSAQRSGQQLPAQKKGGREMLHDICSRNLAGNAAPQSWPDDRGTKRSAKRFCPETWPANCCTKKVAKRCCTRLAPEIWPAVAAPKKVAKRCCTSFAPEIWRAMLHHTFGQTIATQTGLLHDVAQDSARRSGQQLPAQKKVAERCCTIFALGIWRAMLHHKNGQVIAAQKGQPADSARRLGQQLMHQKGGQKMLHKIRPGDLASNCCAKQGGREMLHKPCSRNLAGNAAPQSWPDDRNTKRFATRCCTRLGPEIWPPHKKGGREMVHEICSRNLAGNAAPQS